jgi:6-phosphogluconolactonase
VEHDGDYEMNIKIVEDADCAASEAARFIAGRARAAVEDHRSFVMAVSGGHTPWLMLRDLALEKLPWNAIHVVQADERIAPAGDPDRNLTHLRESLLENAPLPPGQIHPMPVEAPDLQAACAQYAQTLRMIAGSPPLLDLVHLGLGPDGHTASLVPGDSVRNIKDVDVALTGLYDGRRRMTLTYPILNRSRQILWLVTGSDKAEALARLVARDPSIPAGQVRTDHAVIIADRAAASRLGNNLKAEVA